MQMNGRHFPWRPALVGAGVLTLCAAVLTYEPATARGKRDGGTWTLPYTGSVSDPSANAFAVTNTGSGGTGIEGVGSNGGVGVYGNSNSNYGVYGQSSSYYGVFGSTGSSSYAGVYGSSTSGYGVAGASYSGTAVLGTSSSGSNYGVYGNNLATSGNAIGVLGNTGSSTGIGVYGATTGGYGVAGAASSGTAVLGTTSGGSGYGVYGNNLATSGNAIGVYGSTASSSGYAGYFNGNAKITNGLTVGGNASISNSLSVSNSTSTYTLDVTDNAFISNTLSVGAIDSDTTFTGDNITFTGNITVDGTISGSALDITTPDKNFKIDHPLDPANKYLLHNCIESSERLNTYSGNVTLDNDGKAIVQMPDWFQAENKDFRYQLTCVGGFASVYVAKEMENNYFEIAGGKAGLKVSWQVTGVRQDVYSKAHPFKVEVDKTGDEKGKYLDPVDWGKPKMLAISHKGVRLSHPKAISPKLADLPLRQPALPKPPVLPMCPAQFPASSSTLGTTVSSGSTP
jgi:hypothetical protein